MGGDPAPAGPGDPSVEGFGGLVVGQFEDDAQAFFEVVGASEPRVGLHDPGELHLLLLGEIFAGSSSYADIGIIIMPMSGLCRVGVGAVLDPGRPGTIRAGRGVGAGPAPGAPGIVETGRFAGVVPRGPAHVIEGVGGPFDQRGTGPRSGGAFGHLVATTAAIQAAPSAETCVIWAERSGPNASKNDARVALS